MKKPLTPRRDGIFPLRLGAPRLGVPPGRPGGATPAPSAIRWPELSGHERRSPSPCTRRRNVDTRLVAPLGPLRCSIATREGGLTFRAPTVYEIFMPLESQSGQTAQLLAAMFAAVTPAEGPSLGDRMSNPARVASRRGSSCGIAKDARRRTASTRLGQRALPRSGWALQRAQQPHGPDDVATVENAHELGDRQFGVAVGGYQIVVELGLGGAHRVQNCRELVLHNALALYARFPGRVERAAALSVSSLDLPFSEGA